MPNGDKPTVHEHYVPKVYLSGFAADNASKRIYRLSLSNISAGCTDVKIESQAFQNNLYEAKNSSGNFIGRNYIENCLHNVETLYGKYRSALFSEIESCKVTNETTYLSHEMRCFLTQFILLQMVRTKSIIQAVQTKTAEDLKEYVHPNEAKLLALFKLFAFFDTDKTTPLVGASMIDIMLPWLDNMVLFVGYFSEDVLFTSDNPVYALMEDYNKKEPTEILLPLSPRVVVAFIHRDKVGREYDNQILQLSKEWAKHICECTIIGAKDALYSPHKFELNALKEIERIRNMEIHDKAK